MHKTQRTFTKEFKLEAVQLVKSSRKPLAQIARDLGIADSTLHHWRQLFDSAGEQAFPGSGHQTTEVEEIRRLKREVETLRQEREIVKKPGCRQAARTRMKMAYTPGQRGSGHKPPYAGGPGA